MRWVRGIFGARGSSAAAAPAGVARALEPDGLIRLGYDRECEGDVVGADEAYREAVEQDAAHAEARYFLARVAAWDKRYDEAIALLDRACELNPGEATYLFELGSALNSARRYDEALQAFRACLAALPERVPARINIAVALIELDRREEARGDLERLRQSMPDMVEAHFNLAGIYREYARTAEAIAAYRTVRELKPDHAPTNSNLLLMLHYSAEYGPREIFEEHRRYGERFARRYIAPKVDRAWPRRLRIGYLSPDFNSHVVMYFFEPILARHDRSRFEVFCYHTHPEKDVVTERLRAQAEHWVDCEFLGDDELAERIRSDRIDILVDLAGHTARNSLPVLAMKPAPVLATYLGYPDTTGLRAVDYRISDAFADPPGESDRLSVERLMRLPASYFCYRPRTQVPEVAELPALSDAIITFGCFNNFHKMSEPFFDAVARVLAAVPQSRFLLKGRPLSNREIADEVRARFRRAGIAPDRLVLRPWEKGSNDHLAIYGIVDIALDSFPYNGATTTCEALWMGVPVVTVAGDRHAARTGVSLLNAVGLSELVAKDVDEYVAICARLADDRARLAELRRGLRDRMRRSPLMDEEGFARSLETVYLEMWHSHRVKASAGQRGVDEPGAPPALERARALREAGQLADAEALCLELLAGRPAHPEAIALLWDLAFDAGRPGMAIDILQRAIAAAPETAAFHYMLGCALQALGKISDAVDALRCALRLDPTMAKAHNNLGCMYEAAGNVGEAIGCYHSAVAADSGLVEARYNLGNAHRQMGALEPAILEVRRAVHLNPRNSDWHCNLGDMVFELDRVDEAIDSYRAALAENPESEIAHASLGRALARAGRVEEALNEFARANDLKPENADTESWRLWLRHHLDDEDPGDLLESHLGWTRRYTRELTRTTAHPRRRKRLGRRINIGYLLPDPRWCSVEPFLEPLLSQHDASAVTITCYSSHPGASAGMARLRELCPQWRDLSAMNDQDAALRIRADAIDVLIDQAGHGPGGRPLVLARGPAAVQVGGPGYPGTTGLDVMEFRLTDAVADPEGMTERHYSERLFRLPGPLLCYAPPEDAPEPGALPSMTREGPTFGCFEDPVKVSPGTIALWAEILRAFPGSRLALKGHAPGADGVRRGIIKDFERAGVEHGRIVFGNGGRPADRFEGYRAIDVALDTYPCNGMRTTCDALWMGVPVVSLAGNAHRSRLGASILAAAGLAEFAAGDRAGYVSLACELAADAERRRALRAGLRARMQRSPLLDARRYARDMETACQRMLTMVEAGVVTENEYG